MTKFAVYNGPWVQVKVGERIVTHAPPLCEKYECVNHICVWMSDLFCFDHATQSVKQWDLKQKVIK